jgi:hypothetical protein
VRQGGVVQDTTIILKRESERLAGEAEVVGAQMRRLDQVLGRVTQAQAADSSASLDELQALYQELQDDFSEEYLMYNLPAIALTQARKPLTDSLPACALSLLALLLPRCGRDSDSALQRKGSRSPTRNP